MKVLMLGDVVGSPGRRIIKENLRKIRKELHIDAVIANCENAAGGSGLTAALAKEFVDNGIDAITLGDHTWGQKEFPAQIDSLERVVRPGNMAEGCPGKGWRIINMPTWSFIIVNVQGRVFMHDVDCPFRAMDRMLAEMPRNLPIFVDFHAEATSEKITFGHYLDGRVTAVVGTHTHVQTSDAMLLPKGTAFLSDLGMTGPYISSIGRDLKPVTKKFLTGMPSRFDVASGPATIEGAIIDFDLSTRKVTDIGLFRYRERADA